MAHHPDQESPERWQALALLSTTLVLSWSTWFSAAAVVPQLREIWILTPTSSAWLTIAVQVGFVIGALVSSITNLSDIVLPRHVILGGAAGAAGANFLLLVVDGPAVGIPLRFATGFFLAGVYPPAFKLMSTWFRKGRGLALGILAGAIVLGGGLPHLINGLGGLDWRFVIYVTSAATLIGGLLAEFAVTQGPFPFPTAVFAPRQAAQVFSNRGVRLAIIGYVSHMWELFGMAAWILVFLTDALSNQQGILGSSAAYATFSTFVAGSAGCVVGGFMADKWGRTTATIVLMAVSATCALFIGFLINTPFAILILIGLIWGFSVSGDSAQFSTIVTELADQAYVGTALTLQLAAGFSITVITIWLIPILQSAFGWGWAFAFLAPGPIVGVLAMLRLKSLPESSRIAGGLG